MEKKCPMCAELVKVEAKKCKFCGHLFRFGSLTIGQMFYLATVCILFGFYFYFKLQPATKIGSYVTKRFDSKASGIVIENFEVIKKKPLVKILGSAKNTGVDSWSYITIEAKFYDKDEKLLDILTSSNLPLLNPGDSADFKIDNCCGDKKDFIEFDHVKISAKDGIYERKEEEK